MKLHLNKNYFIDAVSITAEMFEIPPIYVEKDYWVTFALHTIFNHEIGKETIFKGGTSLSKCFGLIDRFSEDIDLIVTRIEGEANNQLTAKIRKITEIVNAVMPEVELPEVTNKKGMVRKTAHTYSKEFKGDFGQVRDVIIVEATWLGYHEPYTTKVVSSFIYQMMERNNQLELAEQNGLLPFNVQVMTPQRTLCEKIMSLVRFSYTDDPITDLQNKVRHTYDLYQLINDKELSEFFASDAFDEMLIKVATGDIESFKNNNDWLKNHPKDAKIFNELDKVWENLKSTYNGTFKNLVYGSFPTEEEIYSNLKKIKERISKIDWQPIIDKFD